MADSRKSGVNDLPEDQPTKLIPEPSVPDMIATAVVAAVQAHADGEDPHQAAVQAVTDASN